MAPAQKCYDTPHARGNWDLALGDGVTAFRSKQERPGPASPTRELGLSGAYGTMEFARALGHIGEPVWLERAQGVLLERPVLDACDSVGPYPLFCCENWSELAGELLAREDRWTSVTAVIDPLAGVSESTLGEAFPDQVALYKEHFVQDLDGPLESCLSGHHKRKWRRGRKRVTVERSKTPGAWVNDWNGLYAGLARKHSIAGAADFSPQSLETQLGLPGTIAYRALVEERVVSMIVWYPRGAGVSYHLGATNAEGYDASATYALFAQAFLDFREEGFAWAHLGAGAGVNNDPSSGLNAFKGGWATRTAPAYLCGRILQRQTYERLCEQASVTTRGDFFPAYRAPGAKLGSGDRYP